MLINDMLCYASNVLSGMSLCCGSLNCHLSDGKMYHFCESSKSVETSTGVEGLQGFKANLLCCEKQNNNA